MPATAEPDPWPADFRDLVPEDQHGRRRLAELWRRLRLCAHPALYAAQLGSDELAAAGGRFDVDTAIEHFLAHGLDAGRRISAAFNPRWYADRLTERGLSAPADGSVFFHWLSVGWDERIVPTPLFDEDFYHQQHPMLSGRWGFGHYLTRGIYEARWRPSRFGAHHGGGSDPEAAERHAPLLLREMLHRASEFDLTVTSWLEESVLAAMRKHATLGSPRMQELVAKAAAIEPLVHRPGIETALVSAPPLRAPRLFAVIASEEIRREVGRTRVDTVILTPDLTAETLAGVAGQLAEALRRAEPSSSVLVVATDIATHGGAGPLADGVASLDLARHIGGFDTARSRDVLLDLVRGLAATRVVTVESALGWALTKAYGRQLSATASLGAFVAAPSTDEQGRPVGFVVKELQDTFSRLSWVLVADESLRAALVDRYVMPASGRRRLLTAYAADAPDRLDEAVVKQIVAAGAERREQR